MKNPFKTTKGIKSLTSFFLIFTFIYLAMCPFAHALTSDNGSQELIPQRQVIKSHLKQKDLFASHTNPSTESQAETGTYDKAVINLPLNTHQEPTFSLSIITTIRLII
jgi:hypothetical protein